MSRRIEESPDVNLSPGERNRLLNAIRRVTEGGIVSPETYADIKAGRLKTVRMIHNNTTVSIPTTNYLSARAAYSRLDSILSDTCYRDAIAAVHLPELLHFPMWCSTLWQIPACLRSATVWQQPRQRSTSKGSASSTGAKWSTAKRSLPWKSFEAEIAERGTADETSSFIPAFGRILYLLLLFGSLYAFLFIYRRDYFNNPRTIAFLMIIITGFILFGLLMAATFPPASTSCLSQWWP